MKKCIMIFSVLIMVFSLIVGCAQTTETSGGELEDNDDQGNQNNDANEDNNEGDEQVANSIAVFDTNMGTFKIELYNEKSPVTAGNFQKLVEEGFYDGTRFHRVIANFMIQGGDPLSKDVANQARWGTGDPGYKIEDEFIEGLSNKRGTLSMANSGPNSGGSQFFINVVDNTYLDWDKPPAQSKHPVFGEVVEGMNVVDSISKVAVEGGSNRPTDEVLINSVTIE